MAMYYRRAAEHYCWGDYMNDGINFDDDDLSDYNAADDYPCYYCDGDGWGIVGVDWDSDDCINGPYDGDIERCPCCGGTGRGRDESFW